MAKFLVLHGPNLNLLGEREPALYGSTRLNTINEQLKRVASMHEVTCLQSNAEHELIDAVQKAMSEKVDGIIINPAAFTHTSVALRDALLAAQIPFIEVHLSNIFSREQFRKTSYFSDIALAVITGFGAEGYSLALTHLINRIESH